MPMFAVSVEKRLYSTAMVRVEADTADDAVEKVEEMIRSCALTRTDPEGWSEPTYEDMSFATTGDVDEED